MKPRDTTSYFVYGEHAEYHQKSILKAYKNNNNQIGNNLPAAQNLQRRHPPFFVQ